ncbi:hypothetical protein yc1106_05140 [Curvularia clavata]|uniref:Nuclear speckle splicing regulatory protein 1 N-terminal domain-containing protein n=1 Tax=Curvularia clavata TaxID=95742 RepID=A0A9Q8Z8U4_CURCL|nr:hypothetical protein yc1106_05140 [Curvularia clavata]
MSFKFGLNVKSKGANLLAKAGAKPELSKKKKPLFDDEEDDVKGKAKAADGAQEIGELTFEDTLTVASSESSKPAKAKQKKGQPPAPPSKKPKPKEDDPTNIGYSASAAEAEKRAQEALEADATIYDYDAAYDALHAQDAAKAAADREDAAQRKPKYMDALFEAAEQRKKDQLRARDKLLQREREAEGDEFADKEKFVTGAYKAQQEETRKAEEEEKKRLEAEEDMKKKFGMQGFHKQMLAEQERRHQEAMEAAARALKEGVKLPVEEVEKEKTDAEIADELRKQGKKVILNDDGQVADQRQLLSAGLNVIAKPKPVSAASSSSSAAPASKYTPPSYGNASKGGRNAQRERQTAMVVEQIEAANKRKAEEEAEEQAKIERARKSQKTEKDISSAKERYLQRKREAAAAKAAAAGK